MAIYAIGAYYDGATDVCGDFIKNNIIGVGWNDNDAPELHQFLTTLKVGDIVYIKACSFGAPELIVKAIGFVRDEKILDSTGTQGFAQIARNVMWKYTDQFSIPNPSHKSTPQSEKLNHRSNTIYEEFHPYVQEQILNKL